MTELNELEAMAKKKQKSKSKNQTAAEIAGAEIIESQTEAARFVGKSARTIRRWLKEGMLTATRGGKQVYIKSQLKAFAENEGRKPTEHKLLKEKSEAGIKSVREQREIMQYNIERGKWIDKEEEQRRDASKILAVKRALLGQGRKLAMQLAAINDPRKIQALLDKQNRAIIEGFSR